MCGICGNISSTTQIKPSVIKKMCDELSHRGPDNGSVWLEDNEMIGLGHRRLSIIDLDENANQPFFSSDKRYVLSYNGEIYNFKALKKELKEYDFKTESDTEIIPAAFEKWGIDCLSKFNGMFAFAIYDRKEETLFLARDRFGIKPLYYHLDDNQLLFASEIRPLIHSNTFEATVNKQALHSFIQFQTIPAPQTIIESVKMLLPGHYAVYKKGKMEISQWYKIQSTEKTYDNLEEAQKGIQTKLYESVNKRIISDVPLGAFLSGGIDSSAIVGMMSETSNKKIDTFSVVFGDESYSEAEYARFVSKRFSTNHHEIFVSPDDFLKDVETALDDMDFPTVDGINSWIVSKATKEEGLTVALSGLGSDEIFAGYPHFKRISKLLNNPILRNSPGSLNRLLGNTLNKIRPGIASDKLKDLLYSKNWNTTELYLLMRSIYNFHFANNLFKTESDNSYLHEQLNRSLWKKKNHLMNDISLLEINFYLSNILLRDSDQMSMAHALEVRVPFLDHEVVETVFQIRDKYKLTKQPKQLLTASLKGLLPKEITQRRKMGFLFPWDKWLKDDLKQFAEKNIRSFAKRKYVEEKEVLQAWSGFLNGSKHYNWARVWCFVVLEHWLRKNNIE